MINPINIHPPQSTTTVTMSKGMDFSYFNKNKEIHVGSNRTEDNVGGEMPTPKRGRPKKKLDNGDTIVLADEETNLPKYQSTEPYADSYKDTTMMLRHTVAQIDMLNNDIKSELDTIKGSKTLKNKYGYMSELTSTSSTLLGTKISAIREMNKVITDSHNLDMKRIKEMKMTGDEQDDDKRMMDMYSAFISTPIGAYNPLGPNIVDITLPGAANMIRSDIAPSGDMGYDNYMRNMTPEQNRMRLERNNNVQTVVMYDQQTGNRWFDVIDMNTRESIPNVTRPGDFILEGVTINVNAGTARNSNIDTTYPLVVIGTRDSILDY